MFQSAALKSSRIIHDIDKAIDKAIPSIIKARGCYVAELDSRNGHRRVTRRLTLARMRDEISPHVMEGIEDKLAVWKSLNILHSQ